ncbi:MAG: hypothetical protein WBQ18_06695 [Solirubrobacteraceae bacterium]
MLGRAGIDTTLLLRREGVQTSASVVPIREDGSRPALHVIGANATYTAGDAPWEAIAAATHLHLGAPEFMGGEQAARILAHARQHGVTTSADILAPGDQAGAILDWIAGGLGSDHGDFDLPGSRAAPDHPAPVRRRVAGHRRRRRRAGRGGRCPAQAQAQAQEAGLGGPVGHAPAARRGPVTIRVHARRRAETETRG